MPQERCNAERNSTVRVAPAFFQMYFLLSIKFYPAGMTKMSSTQICQFYLGHYQCFSEKYLKHHEHDSNLDEMD